VSITPRSSKHLDLVNRSEETFVPSSSLTEFDLVMKGRNYTVNQRRDAFDWLANFIPETKIVFGSVGTFKIAAGLEEGGMSYFDSLISAAAIEKDATVLTPDEEISRVVNTAW
jgi:predicted nucleic acid-binding protein